MRPFPFRFSRLTEDQAAAIRKALLDGVNAQVLAGEYRVSVRTIYRTGRRMAEPLVTCQVGDWRARFAITDDGPVQVEPWRPAAEAVA